MRVYGMISLLDDPYFFATFSNFSLLREHMITLAPFSTKARVCIKPIPEPPPRFNIQLRNGLTSDNHGETFASKQVGSLEMGMISHVVMLAGGDLGASVHGMG
jgi:hypothetical protein